MGSGVLKTLSSDEISHHQFLHVFSCGGHSSKPFVCLLLWGLNGRSRYRRFLFAYASIIDYCFASLTGTWSPVALPFSAWLIPRVLGTIATQMSLFMARVTLNFA